MNISLIDKKVSIVSHDAGGAEILSSWIINNPHNIYQYYLMGPAIKIFCRKIKDVNILPNLIEIIDNCDVLITSTSWSSNIEKEAIHYAKQINKKVYTILDHWVNYKLKFTLNKELVLPDEIWTCDKYAYNLAREIFPNINIKQITNYYLEKLKEEFMELEKNIYRNDLLKILYLCEPILDHEKTEFEGNDIWGYNEFIAMEYFLNLIIKNKMINYKIKIRMHPSETENKYYSVLSKFQKLPIELSSGTSLIEDCAWADWIVGQETMALVVGLSVGKEVFSCIPQGGKSCSLPFEEIKKFV